jgi:hypothetical protein
MELPISQLTILRPEVSDVNNYKLIQGVTKMIPLIGFVGLARNLGNNSLFNY